MQILRVRRGYTTNSSGGNEWVPPPNISVKGGGTGQPRRQGTAGTQTSPEGAEGAAAGQHVTLFATQPPAPSTEGQAAAQAAAPAGARRDSSGTNLGTLGSLVGVVCLLFAATGLVKRMLGRGRGRGPAEETKPTGDDDRGE